jgi:uncharacterized membrane protein YcaP (DUF421 family)
MLLQDDDVMGMARDQGITDLSGIRAAVLETFGSISIIPAGESDNENEDEPDKSR